MLWLNMPPLVVQLHLEHDVESGVTELRRMPTYLLGPTVQPDQPRLRPSPVIESCCEDLAGRRRTSKGQLTL